MWKYYFLKCLIFLYKSKKCLEKRVYVEVTKDIFDMSNVRIFKEIEKKIGGCLCLRSAELSKALGVCLRFSDSVVYEKLLRQIYNHDIYFVYL